MAVSGTASVRRRSGPRSSRGGGGPLVRHGRIVRGLDHPTKCADVLSDHEQVAGVGIEDSAAPVGTAESSRKIERASWRSTFGAVQPWRKGSRVIHAPDRLDQLCAGAGVVGRRVLSGDQIGRLVLTRARGGGFRGNGCVGNARSPGTSLSGTARSSTPNIGSPVSRFRIYR